MMFNNLKFNELHEEGIKYSKALKRCETYLIEIIGLINDKKIFLKYNEPNIYSYGEKYFGFSFKKVYTFLSLYEMSKEVPDLKKEINESNVSYSKLNVILPAIKKINEERKNLINTDNSSEKIEIKNQEIKTLLDLSKNKTRKNLEIISRNISPIEIKEHVKTKYLGNNKIEITMTLENEEYVILEKALDLIKRENNPNTDLKEALVIISKRLIDGKLKRGNKKSKIIIDKAEVKTERFEEIKIDQSKFENILEKDTNHIPNKVKERVFTRDGGKCICCQKTINIHFHHYTPKNEGGTNEASNIYLLCSSCHSMSHQGYIKFYKNFEDQINFKYTDKNITSYTDYLYIKMKDQRVNKKKSNKNFPYQQEFF